MSYISQLIDTVRGSVRRKLLTLALLPLALILPIVLAGLTAWGASFTYDQLFIKVNTDLAVAHDAFERIQTDHLDRLARLSESYRFRDALAHGREDVLRALIEERQLADGFSFLRAVTAIDDFTPSTTTARVGIEILGPGDLERLQPGLAESVRLGLVQTKRARPTQRTIEERGMVIRAWHPVHDADGTLIAMLDGGVLLNNNFAFVDAIRDLVYGPGSLPAGSRGTVTVFLYDVRISTNVPRSPGTRALGTRVSEEVSRAVLDRGDKWIDRAFVVNDWYISAYEPIVSSAGQRVGILYAGYLEAPYRAALWKTLGVLVLLLLGLLALYAALAVRGAKSIFDPLERMSLVVQATRRGKVLRVGKVANDDELAELAREFDAMLDTIERHNTEMQRWAEQLEDKVADRTAELQQRNVELQRMITVLRDTRQQLVVAEKLAALGQLTAGVAHEINNPVQVMLGNLDVLIAELGDRLDPVRGEIDLVVEQIYRIQGIIEKLLKYARPDEYAGYVSEIDVNQAIRNTLALVSPLRKQNPFDLRLQLNATIPILISEQELQQVLVNLVSNAAHALPSQQGRIVIATRDWEDKGVCITISDNGCGMDEKQCSQVFNPFYSTRRQGEGTGLGLSISYGLVRRYGGNITVQSKPGVGTDFQIWLLAEPQFTDDAETLVAQLHSTIGNTAGPGADSSGDHVSLARPSTATANASSSAEERT
ncbi:MAG: cache domain-containing protein [Gammaproteobacteria bacterium]|nr:cache domain-containing protein [Gammaproteobacteria bacterium]